MYSDTQENYIKTLFKLHQKGFIYVKTNDLAHQMNTKASSATDMIQKLDDAGLVNYAKYQGVKLNDNGTKLALKIVRKHRLWEYFLVEKLNFEWHEVHEIAEELEHISSEKLIDKLDDFLGNPKKDPHGDEIPNKDGFLSHSSSLKALSEIQDGTWVSLEKVTDDGSDFLQFLNEKNLNIHQKFRKIKTHTFDYSVEISINDHLVTLSKNTSKKLIIKSL